jgi:hypothetical protein
MPANNSQHHQATHAASADLMHPLSCHLLIGRLRQARATPKLPALELTNSPLFGNDDSFYKCSGGEQATLSSQGSDKRLLRLGSRLRQVLSSERGAPVTNGADKESSCSDESYQRIWVGSQANVSQDSAISNSTTKGGGAEDAVLPTLPSAEHSEAGSGSDTDFAPSFQSENITLHSGPLWNQVLSNMSSPHELPSQQERFSDVIVERPPVAVAIPYDSKPLSPFVEFERVVPSARLTKADATTAKDILRLDHTRRCRQSEHTDPASEADCARDETTSAVPSVIEDPDVTPRPGDALRDPNATPRCLAFPKAPDMLYTPRATSKPLSSSSEFVKPSPQFSMAFEEAYNAWDKCAQTTTATAHAGLGLESISDDFASNLFSEDEESRRPSTASSSDEIATPPDSVAGSDFDLGIIEPRIVKHPLPSILELPQPLKNSKNRSDELSPSLRNVCIGMHVPPSHHRPRPQAMAPYSPPGTRRSRTVTVRAYDDLFDFQDPKNDPGQWEWWNVAKFEPESETSVEGARLGSETRTDHEYIFLSKKSRHGRKKSRKTDDKTKKTDNAERPSRSDRQKPLRRQSQKRDERGQPKNKDEHGHSRKTDKVDSAHVQSSTQKHQLHAPEPERKHNKYDADDAFAMYNIDPEHDKCGCSTKEIWSWLEGQRVDHL